MSLESRMEDEKRRLRSEIKRLYAELDARMARLYAEAPRGVEDVEWTRYAAGQVSRRYREPIGILEQRLIQLEKTECRDGFWYILPLTAPGEAQAILERSLAKG